MWDELLSSSRPWSIRMHSTSCIAIQYTPPHAIQGLWRDFSKSCRYIECSPWKLSNRQVQIVDGDRYKPPPRLATASPASLTCHSNCKMRQERFKEQWTSSDERHVPIYHSQFQRDRHILAPFRRTCRQCSTNVEVILWHARKIQPEKPQTYYKSNWLLQSCHLSGSFDTKKWSHTRTLTLESRDGMPNIWWICKVFCCLVPNVARIAALMNKKI